MLLLLLSWLGMDEEDSGQTQIMQMITANTD